MVLAEDPAAVLKHTAAQLAGLAELAAQPGQPGHRLAGGEGVGMIVAEHLPAAAEHLVHDLGSLAIPKLPLVG